MSEWRVLKWKDNEAWAEQRQRLEREYINTLQDKDIRTLGKYYGAWAEQRQRLEREYINTLQDEDIRTLGKYYGPGAYLLLANDGSNKFVEVTIGARQEFFEVAEDADVPPPEAITGLSAAAIMERDG